MRKSRKPMLVGIALALVAALGVGATLAWLTDEADKVTNTFTIGDINITLDEAKVGADGKAIEGADRVTSNSYQLIPGDVYDKDPAVTVEANSEDCYLFVVFTENNAAKEYISYQSNLTEDEGWKQVPHKTNAWYRVVQKSDADQAWSLLAGDKITVNPETVTKDTMTDAQEAELSWTACAVQMDNLTLDQAWAEAEKAMN